MGYSTTFTGQLSLSRTLSIDEARTLTEFSEERHDDATGPGIWCDFAPNTAGDAIIWNGAEKTYDAQAWVQYLIGTFLNRWDITVNGALVASGERQGDVWQLVVEDSEVSRRNGRVVFG